MEVRSFSKSAYLSFLLCSWRCDQIRNKGIKARVGQATRDGREVHKLWYFINKGDLSLDGAVGLASNDEVEAQIRNTARFCGSPTTEKHYEWIQELAGLSSPTNLILDYVAIEPAVILEADLKTGRDERPSLPEMDIYALGGHEQWPGRRFVYFDYFFTRTGHQPRYIYEWIAPHHVRTTGPGGFRRDLFSTDGQDPLRNKVQSYITEMEQAIPTPNPGPHCQSMFGEPCQFLGNGCPLEPDASEIFNAPMPAGEQDLIADNFMRLPEDKRPGAAFMLIKSGYPVEKLPANIISYAHQGKLQLRQGASRVGNAINNWCSSGRTFHVGKAEYGIRPARVTDVKQALKLLAANNVTLEDLAKVVSTSKSKLETLPKRKYGSLGADIAEACVYYANDKEFGKL